MALHLVRHGEAGARGERGDDESRALTPRGWTQADTVAALLGDRPLTSIRTSRYLRCAQTVQPLADRSGLVVVEDDGLAEEARIEATWDLVEAALVEAGDTVLCSHGNVLQALLDRLHRRGVELVASELSFRKGAVWTLEPDGAGGVSRAVLTLPQA